MAASVNAVAALHNLHKSNAGGNIIRGPGTNIADGKARPSKAMARPGRKARGRFSGAARWRGPNHQIDRNPPCKDTPPPSSAFRRGGESRRFTAGIAVRSCIRRGWRLSGSSGPASAWEWLRGCRKGGIHSGREMIPESTGCSGGRPHPGSHSESGRGSWSWPGPGRLPTPRASSRIVPGGTEIADDVLAAHAFRLSHVNAPWS